MEILRVMIVDDEAGMRMGAARVLKEFRFRLPEAESEVQFIIDEAETGEEALEKIGKAAPDVLLLDHKLPGISGIELLERLSTEGRQILTIMITAYASIETAVKATKQGAYDFLPKPFTPAELKYALRKASAHVVLSRRAQLLAEEKKKIRFEFVRVLGHELKAPLGAVENYMRLLKAKTLGENIGAYQGVVERSILRLEQMSKLIADLLDMTKIESGAFTRDLAELDLVEIAGKVLELMEPLAAERTVEMKLAGPEALPFYGDRRELEIILNNLVSNAIKYNNEGGRVEVMLAPVEDGARVTVSDTGIGMNEEETARLFGEFVRIKNERTRNILGSGLGLSIVKRLVGLYDGDVSVESKPGAGTSFSVTLHKPASLEVVTAV